MTANIEFDGARLPRIEAVDHNEATAVQRTALDSIIGRVTNMKRTLARSPVALNALLQWYPLHDAVVPFLGERGASIFCHAISTQSACLICSTYFRRELIDAGYDPDHLVLDPREQTLAEYGRQLVVDANGVGNNLYAQLSTFFTDDQIVDLTAFGALMIATNVFNDALRVDLDKDLEPYRRPEAGTAGA
jgi:alkylhydroperoxidase family enzyme